MNEKSKPGETSNRGRIALISVGFFLLTSPLFASLWIDSKELAMGVAVIGTFTGAVLLAVFLPRRSEGPDRPTSLSTSSERKPDNSQQLADCEAYLSEISCLFAGIGRDCLENSIPARHTFLFDQLEKSEALPFIQVVYNSINFAKANQLQIQMEEACDFTELFLKAYSEELIPLTQEAVPQAAEILTRYRLNQTVLTNESESGRIAMRRNLSATYTALAELGRQQEMLFHALPTVEAILQDADEVKWGKLGLNVASGAIAVFHPIILISLIFRIWKDNEKQKQQEQMVNTFVQMFRSYLEQWHTLKQCYEPVLQSQTEFLTEKSRQIICTTTLRILRDLDAGGFDLKRVSHAYKNYLEDAKRKLENAN